MFSYCQTLLDHLVYFFLPFKNNFLNVCSHCLVVGDRQKHLACLLTVKAVLDPATLDPASLCVCPPT